jgi:hypothetical protein
MKCHELTSADYFRLLMAAKQERHGQSNSIVNTGLPAGRTYSIKEYYEFKNLSKQLKG